MQVLIYVSIFVFVVCKTNSSENTGCGCSLNRQHFNSNNRYRNIRSFYDTVMDTRQCDSKRNTNTMMKDVNIEFKDMAQVKSGEYRIGTDNPVIKVDKESPARLVTLPLFYIDLHEVSNEKFREFISKSGYVTEAEKFGNSFVFQLFLNESFKESLKDYRVANALWWYRVDGANWQHPEGPGSNIEDRLKHPVVHVSWNDARAYCKWARKRLPTENEWEAACRAQHPYRIYPWGDKLNLDDKHWANIWQGKFPNKNTALDGFVGTNPVDEFVQNDLRLCNMAGNVWEWTEDYWNPNTTEMVKKGGSYLCHKSYCFRYRCSARSQNTQDSSAHNLGFRCVKDAS